MAVILVTGGLGFIGSNLVQELRDRGHDTWLCDIRHSHDPKSIRCDIGVFRQVEKLFEDHKFDYVFHAAAEYGRWNGEEYYENLWRTNAVGTKNILHLQAKNKFRMIFFGSAEVYGDYDREMREEVMDDIPIKQMNDYAISKWVNELQILNSAEMANTETVRMRLFNVYGPGEEYTPFRGFIPKFIYHALMDQPYTVYLGHKRTLEYVKDICRTQANIVDNFKPGEVYNLGGDTQYEIKFISDLILDHLGKSDTHIEYHESEPFTTRVKTPNSDKAKKDLKFKLTIPPAVGIPKTIDWFKTLYHV